MGTGSPRPSKGGNKYQHISLRSIGGTLYYNYTWNISIYYWQLSWRLHDLEAHGSQ